MEHVANTPGAKPLRPGRGTETLGYGVIHCQSFFRAPLSNPLVVTGAGLSLSLHAEVAVATSGVIPIDVTHIVIKLILSLSDHNTGLHPTIGISIKIIDFHEVVEVFVRILGGIGEVEGVRSTPNVGSTTSNRHDAGSVIVRKIPGSSAVVVDNIMIPGIRQGCMCRTQG